MIRICFETDSGYLYSTCGLNVGDTIAESESLEVFRDWIVEFELGIILYSIYIPFTCHRMTVVIVKRLKLQKKLVSFQIINIVSFVPKDTPCLSHNGSSMLSIQWCFCRVSEMPLQKLPWFCPPEWSFPFPKIGGLGMKNGDSVQKRYPQTAGQSSVAQDLCMWLKGTHVFLCGAVATFLS